VLTSRTGTVSEHALDEFYSAGVQVLVLKTDASDPDAMSKALNYAREELPYIQHYAHAAGVSGFDMLVDMEPQTFWSIADAKVNILEIKFVF